MEDKDLYKQVLLSGCGIDYQNSVSVCPIHKYYGGRHLSKPSYQVFSYRETEIYRDIDEAVDEFLRMKSKVRN